MADLICPTCKGPAVRVQQDGSLSCVRQCDETPEGRQHRNALETLAANIAHSLRALVPSRFAYVLILSDWGKNGSSAYMSTIRKQDTVSLLREIADKIEASHD